jgi:hypothetical protein
MERTEALNERARHIWSLILEYHRDPRNRQWNGDWFDLQRRITAEGWTASVLRELRKVTTPRLVITTPSGLGQSKPPSAPLEKTHLTDLGHTRRGIATVICHSGGAANCRLGATGGYRARPLSDSDLLSRS